MRIRLIVPRGACVNLPLCDNAATVGCHLARYELAAPSVAPRPARGGRLRPPGRRTPKLENRVLAQVIERGLSGVQLVVADTHAGIAKAVRRHLPEAPLQRCVVHLQRNVVGKAPQRLRARLAREVWRVFEAPSKAEARKRMEQLQAGLGRQVPEAMVCLANGFEAATQFYAFPKEPKVDALLAPFQECAG